MVDQELDALLVGALYGELGPADEARLAAHLESHPTDRTALDDMRTTRKAMADARFFELWFEPSPSLTALLVQEAARRAPRSEATGDGWFARFARSFMRHPAMAAAAMLVVVVGVAGTLYMKKGDLAEPSSTVVVQSAPVAASTTQPTTPPTVAYGSAAEPPPSAAYANPTGNTKTADGISADLDDKALALDRARGQNIVATKPTVEHAIKQGLEVAPKRYEPKDLAKDDDSGGLADNEPAQPEKQQSYKGKAAAPPPPPASAPAPQNSMATVGTATTPTTGAGGAANGADAPADPWAREQHETVKSLVAAGRCTDAANAAAKIQARSPDYYAINIANDIKLKQCASYIAREVEKQEDTRSKAAATKASKAATDTSK